MKKKSLISLKTFTISVSAAIACTAIPAHAATYYWDGTSTSGNADGGIGAWDNGITSNWCTLATGGTNTAWTNGNNIADFGATAGTVTLGAPITVGGLQFDTAGYIVQTGTLTFGTSGNIVTNASAAINSAIAAASGITITKTGTATLTLGGSNTYAGPTTISVGTLTAGGVSAFSANSTFTVTGGVLDLNGFNATVAALGAGNSAGTITNSAAGSGTSTLTVTTFNVGLASLITDGTAQKTALAINAYSTPNFGNANNTFSGGITIANNARLWQGSISTTLSGSNIQKSNFGTGTVTIGNSTSNGQLYLTSGAVYNPIVVNSATFADGGSAAFRIDGTGVQLYGQLTANLVDINMSSGGTGSVTAFGQLTGSNGLSLKTPGTSFTLALSNTSASINNYQGNTTIGTKTILVLSGSGVEQIPNGSTAGNVALSGTLNMGGNSETINGLSGSGTVDNGVSGTPTLTVGDNNATSTFSGPIVNTSGTLALTKIGTGTLTLSGTNTYAGATQVNGGLLVFSSSSAKSSGTATTLAAASIGLGVGAGSGGYGVADVAALFNTNTLSGFNLVAGSGVALDTTGGNFNQTTGLTAARALTKLGSNTLTLSGSNSYSGNTTVSVGTLKAGGTSALSANSAFSVAAGATLDLGGYNNTIKSLGVDTATSTITDSSATGSGGTLKVSTALGGTACAQLFTGSLGLQIFGGGNTSILGNANSTYSGGTLYGANGSTSTRWLSSGVIGTLTSGTVSKGIFGIGPITIGSATTDKAQFYFTGATTINNAIVMNTAFGDGSQLGAFRLEASGGLLTIAGTVNANLADLMFEANNNQGMIGNVTGAISGSSGLQVLAQNNGGLIITLTSTNTLNSYAGNTTITNSGTSANAYATLKLGAADQIPNGAGKGNLIVTSGSFNMNGFNETINGLSGGGTVDGASGTPTLTVGDNNATSTFSGKILNTSGTLSLTKIGAGTLTLSGSNSYTGATAINAGILQYSKVQALPSASTVTVNSAGALGLNVGGTNEFTSANLDSLLSGTGGVTFNTGASIALDTSNAGGTFTYASLISGSVGVIKLGASNPLVLSSSNTYLGVTKLSAGGLNSVILANGGMPSTIGQSSNAAANLVIENGAQLNISTSGTTDRLFTLGSSGQAWIAANGGNFTFSNAEDVAVSGSATHNLRLGGVGSNTFAPAVHDYNSLNKTQFTVQNCAWTLTGTSSDYTGVTNIDAAGTMLVTSLANGGVASSIGAASNAASNLVFGYDAAGGNNTLSYIGTGAASTDRLFTLGNKLGAGETSTISNSGGDTLSFTNAGAIAVTCTGSTVLGFSGSTAISFAPIIANGSATVGLNKSGINTITLTAANTYTGATTVSSGTLQIGNSGTTGSIASTSGVTLSTGSATLAFARTDDYGGSFSKKISGSGGLALNSGSLTLTGSNTYNGATTVAAGAALQVGDGVTGAMASTVTLNNGSTLGINLPNGGLFSAGINMGSGTVNLTSSGTNTITGQVNGFYNCTVNQNGTGTTILSGAINLFYGTANVNAGGLQLNAQYSAVDATINVGSAGLLTFGTNAVNVIGLTGSGGVVLQNGSNGMTLSVGGNNQSTAFGGILSGSNGALTVTGTNNVLTLTGLNTYTGLTTVSSGSLQIGNGGTTGSIASSGSISIASGATLAFNRADDYGTILSQPLTGTGRLLIASGSLTVSSTSSFSGDLVLAGGSILTGTNAPLSNANLDGEGGTLNIGPMLSASFGGLKGAGNLNVVSTSGSTLTLNVGGNNQNTTFSGGLSGSNLALIKAGTRTLTLTGSNSFTGGITVTSGGLTIGNVNAMGGGILTTAMDAGITLTVNLPTSGTIANSMTFTRPAGVQNEFILQGGNNNLTLAGNIYSPGNNVQFYPASGITSGTITLTGSNAFGGGAFFGQDLTIRFGSNYAGGTGTLFVTRPVETTPISVIVLNGVNLQAGISANGGSSDASPKPVYIGMEASGTASIIGSILMLNSATNGRTYYYQAPAGAQFTASGALSGGVNSPVVTTGSGTVIFNNSSSSYGGSTTIGGGILQVSTLANGASNSSIGASTNAAANLVLNGGTLKYTGGTVSTDRQFTLGANGGGFDASGSGPLTFSSAAAVAYSGSGNRTLALAGANTGLNTLEGSIADNGADIVSLVKSGAGTWVLSGSNSYSGGTQVNGGLLVFGNTSANSSGTVTTVAAASIGLGVGAVSGGFSDSNVADLFNTNTLSGFNLAAGSGVALDTTGGDFTQTTGLTAARALTKLGSNTLTLSGSNTYTGNTTISAGTLRAGGASAFTTSGTFSIATGATLDLGGFNSTTNSLSTTGTGTITDSSSAGSGGTLRISTALGSTLLPHLFTGSLGLQIFGGNAANALLGNATNTYSGGTILGNGSGTTLTRWLGYGVIGTLTSGTVSSGIFGTGAITIGAATTDRSQVYFSGGATVNNAIVVNSSQGDGVALGALRVESGGVTIAGAINANLADVMFETNNGTGRAATVTGAIFGSSGFQVYTQTSGTSFIGGLTVTLNSAGNTNSYAGNTTISGNGNATLKLGASDQIPNGAGKGNLVVTSGTFNMAGFNETINGISGGGTVDGSGGTPTLTVGDNDASGTFSGKILNTSGTLALTKIGAGTLTLSGSNSYSGGTTVASGSLQLGNAAALGTGGLTVNGGSLDLHGYNATVPSFSGSGGAITNTVSGTSTLTMTVASGTATYAGNITDGTGSVVLTNSGAGMLILSGSLSIAGLNANASTIQLAQSGSIGAISISAAGKLELTANGVNSAKVIDTSALSIATGGTLDLWDNALILRDQTAGINQGANLSTIQGLVNTAFDNGNWDKPGITSSSVNADLGAYSVLTVMVYDNTVLGVDSFEGINNLTTDNGGNQVMLKVTYLGDFDGNGIVNSADYGWLDFYYGYGLTVGDLNGDGQVNSADYNGIDYGYGYQAYGVLADGGIAVPAAATAAPASPETVPEPGVWGLLMSGLGLLVSARRRKANVTRTSRL